MYFLFEYKGSVDYTAFIFSSFGNTNFLASFRQIHIPRTHCENDTEKDRMTTKKDEKNRSEIWHCWLAGALNENQQSLRWIIEFEARYNLPATTCDMNGMFILYV